MCPHVKDKNEDHQHMSEIVQFIMCHRGTDTSTERVLSLMNKLWVFGKRNDPSNCNAKSITGKIEEVKQ